VNDFWETNLSGLAALSAEQKAIKLIEISVAAADRPGILEEFVQGTKFWLDHRRTADCPHDAMERFQGKCDGGLRMYWSKGLD
jgi:hypothetical protein